MKALRKRPDEPWKVIDIKNTLKALQNEVGGPVDKISLSPDSCFLVDEDGRLKGKSPCCNIAGLEMVGTVLIVGVDGDEFTDVPIDFSNAAGDTEIMKHLEMTPLEMVACYMIADLYGLEPQLRQTMEECGELIQACNKYLRQTAGGQALRDSGANPRDSIIEEIADVKIMLRQIEHLLDIDASEVGDVINAKIVRQLKCMEGADSGGEEHKRRT